MSTTVRGHVDMQTNRRNSKSWRRFYDENSEVISSCSLKVWAALLYGKLRSKREKTIHRGASSEVIEICSGCIHFGYIFFLLLTLHSKCLYVAHSINRSKFSLMVRASPTKKALAIDVLCV